MNHKISDAGAGKEQSRAAGASEIRFTKIMRKLDALTWMVGTNLALSVVLFWKVFSFGE